MPLGFADWNFGCRGMRMRERLSVLGGSGCGRRGGRGFGRWFHFHFPIAAIFDARPEDALFGALFDDEWRSALRAGLVDRLVRRSEIAIRVAAATVENAPCAAAFRSAATHKFAFVALRAFDAERNRAGVFALRIILAADEIAEASLSAEQERIVERALFWYCRTPNEAMAMTPAVTNAQRRVGQVSHPLGDGLTTVWTGSVAGKASATTSRQSPQRARCSSTMSRSSTGSECSAKDVSRSASG